MNSVSRYMKPVWANSLDGKAGSLHCAPSYTKRGQWKGRQVRLLKFGVVAQVEVDIGIFRLPKCIDDDDCLYVSSAC